LATLAVHDDGKVAVLKLGLSRFADKLSHLRANRSIDGGQRKRFAQKVHVVPFTTGEVAGQFPGAVGLMASLDLAALVGVTVFEGLLELQIRAVLDAVAGNKAVPIAIITSATLVARALGGDDAGGELELLEHG